VRASGVVEGDLRAPHAPAGPAGAGPLVTFSRSDLAVPWDDRFASLLDLAEACDVPAGFGCRQGVCHACESGLLDGDPEYHIDPLEPPAEGRVLLCCARPASEVTLDL
jgi:ferredoxin